MPARDRSARAPDAARRCLARGERSCSVWVVAAAVLVALSTACSGDDDPATTPAVPLDIPPGSLALPPEGVDGLELTELGFVERPGEPAFRGPIVVTTTSEGVVAVTTINDAAAEAAGFPDFRDFGEPGPLVNGVESRAIRGFGLYRMPSLIFEPSPGVVVELSSRDLTSAELATVAAEVTMPVDEPGAVPGEVHGVLSGTFGLSLPGAVSAEYHREGRRGLSVTIAPATPAEQAAVLALTHPDPEDSIDPMTEGSCCASQIMARPRERTIRGARATIATLTPYQVVLVLEGESGVVITTTPPQAGGGIPLDDRLVAIAEGIRPGTDAELDELVRAVDRAEADRQIAQISAEEEERGSVVLTEHRASDRGLVIVSSDADRPEIGIEGPLLCAALADGNQPACLTPEAMGAALAMGSPAADLVFGAISQDVDSVEIRFPKGTRSTEIFDVDPDHGLPRRVFVALLPLDDVSRLTDSFQSAADATVVALDAQGDEVARAPLFENLQDGEPPETPGSTTSIP